MAVEPIERGGDGDFGLLLPPPPPDQPLPVPFAPTAKPSPDPPLPRRVEVPCSAPIPPPPVIAGRACRMWNPPLPPYSAAEFERPPPSLRNVSDVVVLGLDAAKLRVEEGVQFGAFSGAPSGNSKVSIRRFSVRSSSTG